MIVKTAYDLVPYLEAIEKVKSSSLLTKDQQSQILQIIHRHSLLSAMSTNSRSNQKYHRRNEWEHPKTHAQSRQKKN